MFYLFSSHSFHPSSFILFSIYRFFCDLYDLFLYMDWEKKQHPKVDKNAQIIKFIVILKFFLNLVILGWFIWICSNFGIYIAQYSTNIANKKMKIVTWFFTLKTFFLHIFYWLPITFFPTELLNYFFNIKVGIYMVNTLSTASI